MTVLLLDDRWPTLIPLEAFGRLGGPLEFTDEVPVGVRWNIDKLVDDYTATVSRAVGRELTWDRDDTALQNIQARTRGPAAWLLAMGGSYRRMRLLPESAT